MVRVQQVGRMDLSSAKFVVSGVGSKNSFLLQLTIQIRMVLLKPKQFPQYVVGSPTGASVSADAVKVLYIGVVNPISVYGGNVGDEGSSKHRQWNYYKR